MMRTIRRARGGSQLTDGRGFTLIELLVVISVIGILAALLTPAFMTARRDARLTQARSDCRNIEMAFNQYHSDFGVYPPDYIPPQAPHPSPPVKFSLPGIHHFCGGPDVATIWLPAINNGLNSGECLVFFLGTNYSTDPNAPRILQKTPWDGPFYASANANYLKIPKDKLWDHDGDGYSVWVSPFGKDEPERGEDDPPSWFKFDNNEADDAIDPRWYRNTASAVVPKGGPPFQVWPPMADEDCSPYNRNVTNVHDHDVDVWTPSWKKLPAQWADNGYDYPESYGYCEHYNEDDGAWYLQRIVVKDDKPADTEQYVGSNFTGSRSK